MKKLIIFDLDGVVVDSEVIANRVLAELVSQLGFAMTTDDAIREFAGNAPAKISEIVCKLLGHGVPDDFADRVRAETLARLQREVTPIEGVTGFISQLDDTLCCIASSSGHERIRVCLEISGLNDAFRGAAFSASDVERAKPYPDIFLYAAAPMGAEPAQCLIIEDGIHGTHAGVAAGMQVIGFTGGSHIRPGHEQELLAAGAGRIVASYAELSHIFQNGIA